jgi:hypothetical protein
MKMRILAVLAGLILATGAHAATITQFGRTTNDGVWSLTAEQASALGVTGATKMGAFRVRSGNGVAWAVGDTFGVSALNASIVGGGGTVYGYFNGFGDSLLGYTGGFLAPLGTTTFLASSSTDGDLYRGVFFAFTGNVVFRGTSNFNQVNQGAFTLAPIPVPAALPLLLAGLGGLALVARRRKAA